MLAGLDRAQPTKGVFEVLRLEHERSRHDDVCTSASQKRNGMAADAAIGNQPDPAAASAQHPAGLGEASTCLRRQVVAFHARLGSQQKDAFDTTEVRLNGRDRRFQTKRQPGGTSGTVNGFDRRGRFGFAGFQVHGDRVGAGSDEVRDQGGGALDHEVNMERQIRVWT